MLTWYASAGPVLPPEPAVPVTVPVLYPTQIIPPLAGLAELKVGAAGALTTDPGQMVLHADVVQPVPPVRCACTITLPVAPVVVMAVPLVYADHVVPPLILY